jgi:hypothetical protein
MKAVPSGAAVLIGNPFCELRGNNRDSAGAVRSAPAGRARDSAVLQFPQAAFIRFTSFIQVFKLQLFGLFFSATFLNAQVSQYVPPSLGSISAISQSVASGGATLAISANVGNGSAGSAPMVIFDYSGPQAISETDVLHAGTINISISSSSVIGNYRLEQITLLETGGQTLYFRDGSITRLFYSSSGLTNKHAINFAIADFQIVAPQLPVISQQPSSQAVIAGASTAFTVTASSPAPQTYQWRKDGTAIAGATSATLALSNVQTSAAGSYTVVVSNSAGSVTSSAATLTVTPITAAPVITTPPTLLTVTVGGTASFTVTATGNPTPTYQWKKNGTVITGATAATLTLANTQTSDAANYTVTVTNSAGAVTSSGAMLTVNAVAVSRLANLSVRAPAGTGDQTLIVGFYIGGAGSKQVLLRGIGPTLAQYGVSGVLADPQLKLFNAANTLINQNDDWGGSAALANAFAAVQDFALPANSKDAALLVALLPNGYTAQVNGAGTSTGVAMIEAYEADTGTPGARFTALSARNQVGAGENILIAGFAVTGNAPKKLLIRGIGPTLANYGVSGVLADPKLDLYSGNTWIDGNDNWGGTTALSDAFTATQAFPLPANSKDAALLVTLQPGLYSAQVSGVGGTTGVALVEVYEMP